MPQKASAIDNRRGTALWAFNRLRSDALVMLMNDLVRAQSDGLNEEQCDHVKIVLAQVSNCATALPDGSAIRKAIWQEFQRFEDIYASWNDPKGNYASAQDHRKKELRKLRRCRHKLARRTRKNLHILEDNLDLAIVDAAYGSLEDLIKLAPEVFRDLSKAIKRFAKSKNKMR